MPTDDCATCCGTGGSTRCYQCGGSGYEANSPNAPQPLKEQLQICRVCRGKCRVSTPCPECGKHG